MLLKALLLFLTVALLWSSGCASVTPNTDPGAPFGACAKKMPYYYCGPG